MTLPGRINVGADFFVLLSLERRKSVYTTISIYTQQKKKRNNHIPLNFEKTLIESEIIAFSSSAQASECKKPIFILMRIYGVIRCRPWAC